MSLKLSIVAPVYNEATVLETFISEIVTVLESINVPFEIILSNDGSTDETERIISRLAKRDSRILGINLSRNFGQHAAISAGINRALGDFIVVMDSDLQDDPEAIKHLLKEIERGFDIVFVARTNRKVSNLYTFFQFLFYKFLNLISDLSFDRRFGNYSIISKRVREAYINLNDSIKYYPAALRWLGFSTSNVNFEQRRRKIDTHPKYNFRSRLRLAFEIIVSHSRKPLHLAILLGGFIGRIGVCIGVVVLWLHVNNRLTQPGWASLFVTIITLSGGQLFTLGIFGLYIGDIANSSQRKPHYIEKID